MKKNLLSILFLIIGCASSSDESRNIAVISDFDTDFPTTDTIKFEPKQRFDIGRGIRSYNITDSVLWTIEINSDRLGCCYNINTGKEIANIMNIGRANNEIIIESSQFPTLYSQRGTLGDSVQIIQNSERTIRTFAKTDIVNNIPMSDRGFSIVKLPDSMSIVSMIKLPDGAVLGTNTECRENDTFRFFIMENNKITEFGNLRKELYELKDVKLTNNRILEVNSHASILNNKNRAAVVTRMGIALNVINTDKKTVCAEKYYDKVKLEKNASRGKSMNTFLMSVGNTDKYIFWLGTKRDYKKTKDGHSSPGTIIMLVFDWELNPVKRFHIDCDIDLNAKFAISGNCEEVYYMIEEEDGPRQLMVGKIEL